MFSNRSSPSQGVAALGLCLPDGLQSGAVHELRAREGTAGHLAVAAMLLAQLPGAAPILWVSRTSCAYPPGIAWLGLDPGRCLFAQASNDAQSLGTLETGLRGGMTGVVECAVISRLAARRLALAAKTGGSIGFVLRHAPAFTSADSNAFASRWMISPASGGRLRAELLYAKGGRPGEYLYEIREVNHGATPLAFTLVEQGIAAERHRRTG